MKRRAFATACAGFTLASAGCLSDLEPEPTPKLVQLELENHRSDSAHRFTIRIANRDEVAFEEVQYLSPAGSGADAIAFENPVEPGEYTVRIDAEGHTATVNTRDLVTAEEPCLRLVCYLDDETLHVEHQTSAECG